MDWKLLIVALGLVFFMEGTAYALMPDKLRRLLVAVLEQPVAKLRWVGLTLAVFGVAIIWLVLKL